MTLDDLKNELRKHEPTVVFFGEPEWECGECRDEDTADFVKARFSTKRYPRTYSEAVVWKTANETSNASMEDAAIIAIQCIGDFIIDNVPEKIVESEPELKAVADRRRCTTCSTATKICDELAGELALIIVRPPNAGWSGWTVSEEDRAKKWYADELVRVKRVIADSIAKVIETCSTATPS